MIPPEYLPFDREVYRKLYRQIRDIPVTREITCANCGHTFEFFTIQTHADCEQCGEHHRTRAFGAYDEIEDLASIFVLWASQAGNTQALIQTLQNFSPVESVWDDWDDYFCDHSNDSKA